MEWKYKNKFACEKGSTCHEYAQSIWSGEEYNELLSYCNEAIESYYKYYNSVFGILESINKDYKDLNLDATEIQKALSDPENMGLLRDILTKLG